MGPWAGYSLPLASPTAKRRQDHLPTVAGKVESDGEGFENVHSEKRAETDYEVELGAVRGKGPREPFGVSHSWEGQHHAPV